jgi:hypothetical protein
MYCIRGLNVTAVLSTKRPARLGVSLSFLKFLIWVRRLSCWLWWRRFALIFVPNTEWVLFSAVGLKWQPRKGICIRCPTAPPPFFLHIDGLYTDNSTPCLCNLQVEDMVRVSQDWKYVVMASVPWLVQIYAETKTCGVLKCQNQDKTFPF